MLRTNKNSNQTPKAYDISVFSFLQLISFSVFWEKYGSQSVNFVFLMRKFLVNGTLQIVFMVFTPSLMFASLAKTVTLEDIISWYFNSHFCTSHLSFQTFRRDTSFNNIGLKFYFSFYRWFMPVNIGLTFLCGGILGWLAVKILKPKPHMEGIIIAICSTGRFS